MSTQGLRHERASNVRRPNRTTGRTRSRLVFESLEDRIACSAGDLDTLFNGTGKLAIQVGSANNDVAHAVAVQPDGKTVLAGTTATGSETDFAVVRLNPDGSLDTSFGTGGIVTIPVAFPGQSQSTDDAESVLIQTDGRIVVVGSVSSSLAQSDFAAVRLTTKGQLDTSFGVGGIQTVAFAGSAKAYGAALQTNGMIVLAGEAQVAAGSSGTVFAVARLTVAGVLDSQFGQQGEQTVALASGSTDAARAVAIQKDGSIVLAGAHGTGLGISVFGVARLTPDGTLDTKFGSGGVQSFALSPGSQPSDSANALAIRSSDGSIVVAGSAGNGFGVARLTASGVLDASFNQTGKYVLQFPDVLGFKQAAANGVVLESDGKLLVAGSVGSPSADFVIIRLNTNGMLDSTFGASGQTSVAFDLGGPGSSDNNDLANEIGRAHV